MEANKTPKPRWVEAVEALQNGLASVLKTVATILAIGLAGALIWIQVRRVPVVIEPFEAPEELQKLGWTGKTLAGALLDELRLIENRADTAFFLESRFSPAWSPKAPDLEIGDQGFSVASLTQAIQVLTGRRQSVTGELVQVDESLELRLRSTEAKPRCYRWEPEEKDSLPRSSGSCVQITAKPGMSKDSGLRQILIRAGEDLYLDIEPLIVAAATFDSNQGRCQEAIDRALANDAEKDDAWAYNLLGELLRENGRFAEAEHQYRHALEADPELAQAYNNWALALETRGDLPGALALLQKAASHNPRLAQVRSNLGRLLSSSGSFSEALRQHRTAIRLKPLEADFHYNYADDLYIAKRYDEAVEAFERVEVLAPRDTEASMKRGVLLLCQQEQTDMATASFRRAAEAHQPRCSAYLGLRAVAARQRQGSQADFARHLLGRCIRERAWRHLRFAYLLPFG